jgi:hypothetical protein
MRRNLLVAMLALGLVVVGARGVIAATGRTPVDCIDTAWRSSPVSTSSTTWEAVPGFEADPTAIFPITVDVKRAGLGRARAVPHPQHERGGPDVRQQPRSNAFRTRGDRSERVFVPVGGAR